MQPTRRYILEILRERGEATVDEIVDLLQQRRGKDITPVTVRHHINLLQQEALVTSPELRRRSAPGRPQHVYALTEKAREHFPNNYERLVAGLMHQLERALPSDAINVIFEGVAAEMAAELPPPPPGSTVEERLNAAVAYLNTHGYEANWEQAAEGYLLHTHNCPYHHIASTTQALCHMDMRLIAGLLGVIPRPCARQSNGDHTCSYLIPADLLNNSDRDKKN